MTVGLVLGLAMPTRAGGVTGPWEVKKDSDVLVVRRREVPGSRVAEVEIEAVLAASSTALWRAIRDVAHYHEFLPYVAEARILEEQAGVRLIYQRVDPPLVNDRDYVLRQTAREDLATGVFEQEFAAVADKGPPPVEGVVRVTLIRGRWLLEPIDPHNTRLVYRVLTDPGGNIPAWAIHAGQARGLRDLLEAVLRRAQRD